MHKFIYSTKDSYINNTSKYEGKNFGIDEVLEIYASNKGTKTEFLSYYWHDAPQTTSSYGNEGWLAFTTSSLYVYSGSKWRRFDLTSDTITGTSFLANFNGKFLNKTSSTISELYVSGSGTSFSSYLSGSFQLTTNSTISGSISTGSFTGSIKQGSSFGSLFLNNKVFTSNPLTSSIQGSGSFGNFSGIITSSFIRTGPKCGANCLYSGSGTVKITSSVFNGLISSELTDQRVYFAKITDFLGYFKGIYTGSFTRPKSAEYLLYPEFSRTLLQFDLTEISKSVANNTISGSNVKFTLNLKACGARNLPLDYKIYAFPVSQSWQNGNGRYADDGSELGVSWYFRNYSGSGTWYDDGNYVQLYEAVDYLETSSFASASWQNGGGTWFYDVPESYNNKKHWICSSSAYTPLSGSSLITYQQFSYGQQSDLEMDITKIVRSWLCGCVPNNGLILLSSFEIDVPPVYHTDGLLQFFSRETNTIYSPYIDVAWDDSVFNTGNLAPLSGSTDNVILLQYIKDAYKAGSLPKIFVFGRDRYPLKGFTKAYQQSAMLTPKYLPSSSYYMIKDAESEEVLVEFDEYSKLSCDATKGNYFKLDTSFLPQERYFKILIKVEYSDGTTDIVDTQKIFKVTR